MGQSIGSPNNEFSGDGDNANNSELPKNVQKSMN